MCGIHGILDLNGSSEIDPGLARIMGDVTRHRGPDDAGHYAGEGVLLGMRRLSIIDVTGGHQPIANEDRTLWLVCNGEIYNFLGLRDELKRLGHTFSTRSDSEVVLHLYEQYGLDFIEHIDGMFGLALWDSVRRRLVVARDRLGIKPLYYRLDRGRLVFASEAKSILALPDVTAELDDNAVMEYLGLGYVPAPHCIFRGMRKLPPAALMVAERGELTLRRYWQLPSPDDGNISEAQWSGELLERLEHAVVSQMVSDVPIGAFLSGGIDSSCVTALMSRHSSQPVKTYSIGFDTGKAGSFYNELPWARQVAELLGTDHHEIMVRPDVTGLLPELLWYMDEPVADTALLTTYLVSRFAREEVTVILSGVGGDELFGGYRRYLGEYYSRYYNMLPAWLRRGVLQPVARHLPSDRHSALLNLLRYARSFVLSGELSFEERYRSYVQVFSPESMAALTGRAGSRGADALSAAFGRAASGDNLYRLYQVDLETQLPDDLLMLTDRMSMATSLECRVPLLDTALVEFAARMPSRLKINGRELKYILKKSLATMLPHDILYRKKRGFGAPMGAWLKQELKPVMERVLSRESVEQRGLFRWEAIEDVMAAHMANREDHTDHLLSLMNLELWCRIYLDDMSPADLSGQLAA